VELRKNLEALERNKEVKRASILNELDERIRERMFVGPFPDEFYHMTFDQIDLYEGRTDAIDAALGFAEKFSNRRPLKGLYLYGPIGVGKSQIASALVHALLRLRVDSMMVYVPTFVSEIANKKDEENQSILEYIKKSTVLVLDDIGVEVSTLGIEM